MRPNFPVIIGSPFKCEALVCWTNRQRGQKIYEGRASKVSNDIHGLFTFWNFGHPAGPTRDKSMSDPPPCAPHRAPLVNRSSARTRRSVARFSAVSPHRAATPRDNACAVVGIYCRAGRYRHHNARGAADRGFAGVAVPAAASAEAEGFAAPQELAINGAIAPLPDRIWPRPDFDGRTSMAGLRWPDFDGVPVARAAAAGRGKLARTGSNWLMSQHRLAIEPQHWRWVFIGNAPSPQTARPSAGRAGRSANSWRRSLARPNSRWLKLCARTNPDHCRFSFATNHFPTHPRLRYV